MLRQRAPRRLLRFGGGRDGRGDFRRGRCQPFCLVGFQSLKRQIELLGVARQLLGGTAELGPSITGQLKLQSGDLGIT